VDVWAGIGGPPGPADGSEAIAGPDPLALPDRELRQVEI
jgi:hypothetical protein